VSLNASGSVQTRVTDWLVADRPPTVVSATAVGLVLVTDLLDVVLWDPDTADRGRRTAHRYVEELRRRHPSLHALVAHTEAAASALTLAPR
jgi:hypothetical protein